MLQAIVGVLRVRRVTSRLNDCAHLLIVIRAFLVLTIAGCSAPQQSVEIPFKLNFGGRPLSCDGNGAALSLTDFRFYVHDVRLVNAGGEEFAVTLAEDPLWQNTEVALLDLENGSSGCTNGTEQRNDVVRGHAPAAEYVGLTFRLGVPEHLNHADPLQARAPLNYSFMHWHWRTGYKFLRAGVATADDGFWIHLGSSRCEGTASNVTGCRSGNRPSVNLAGFSPGRDVVEMDLRELVRGIDLSDGRRSDCSSGPAEYECKTAFEALGLSPATGEAVASPLVFRVGVRQ